MKQIHDFHHEAMRLADEADRFRRDGDLHRARESLLQAFEQERHAAEQSARELFLEPTRSVLHRSAASLAIECGKYREAERLIATALSGDPPDEIAEELRDLLAQVYFDPPRPSRRPLSPSTAN